MSRIIQFQRRAIESLWNGLSEKEKEKVRWSKDIRQDSSFFYESKNYQIVFPLGFFGISEGVGTCADVHDINVAVFGKIDGTRPKPYARYPLSSCGFAVLLRKPTPEETKEWNKPGVPHLTVELLYVSSVAFDGVTLRSYKGIKVTYCNLI